MRWIQRVVTGAASMTSGKERRRAARALLAQKLSEQYTKRAASLAGAIGAELIGAKLDQSAGNFIKSRDRVLRNAAVLDASTAGSNGPLYVVGRDSGGTTGLVYVPPMCVRCSARPIVSSVRSRAAYCEHHWLELWNAGT